MHIVVSGERIVKWHTAGHPLRLALASLWTYFERYARLTGSKISIE